jgi:Phosphoribulokinase / Uridine kinase family
MVIPVDKTTRGYSSEAVVDTILRRISDYVKYISPPVLQDARELRRLRSYGEALVLAGAAAGPASRSRPDGEVQLLPGGTRMRQLPVRPLGGTVGDTTGLERGG